MRSLVVRRLLPLLYALWLAGPAHAVPQDIRARLQRIADRVADSAYQGDANVRRLLEEWAQRDPAVPSAESAKLLLDLGKAELRIGREREAIAHLEQALELLPEDTPRARRVPFSRAAAVAWLRLAETENCCASNRPESCIVPLREGALHTKRTGSSAAIEHLRRMLAEAGPGTLDHALGLWLLNLAHMTLGDYPDGVPRPLRIDTAHFASRFAFPAFPNVAAELGVDTFSLAGGAVVDDLDGDGDLDLLTSTHDVTSELRLFLGDGKGGFEAGRASGLEGLYGGLNLVHADYDNDGDPDILVLRGAWLHGGGQHPNSLLRNDGLDGEGRLRFRDVTFEEGLGGKAYPTQTAAWADYDNDGDLDLYVGNESSKNFEAPSQLFRNGAPHEEGTPHEVGAPRFVDVAAEAGVLNGRYAKGVVFADYDGDGDADLYVSNYGAENRLYRNAGDGTFEDVAKELGVHEPRRSFPAWFWDFDNDGALDLFVSNYRRAEEVAAYYTGAPTARGSAPRLLRGDGEGKFEDVTSAVGLERPMCAMGCNFGDLNNDGFLDFYLGTGHPDYESVVPNLMFLNDGGRHFVDVTMNGGFGHLQKGHAVVFADLDGDGDQDVFEQMGGAYQGDGYHDALFRNPGFGKRWVGLKLVGTRSNRSAIGARIEVRAADAEGNEWSVFRHVGAVASFGSAPLEQHVGLGDATRIVRVEVHWPASGTTQTFTELGLDERYVLTEDRERAVPLGEVYSAR